MGEAGLERDASFGRLLRRLRRAHDLTQEALAQQSYCALDTIKKIEAGVRRPSRQLAAQLADCLGLAGDERVSFLAAARPPSSTDGAPAPVQAASELSQPLPSGTVTFLFTDIEASTPLWEREPEQMQLALAHHDAILRTTISTHGGHAYKVIGDAFQAAFAFPAQAVAAALAAQRALAAQ